VPFLKKKNQKGTLERSQTAPLRFPLRNPGPGVVLKVKKKIKGTLERSKNKKEIKFTHPPQSPSPEADPKEKNRKER
jgi:hypothetical protein